MGNEKHFNLRGLILIMFIGVLFISCKNESLKYSKSISFALPFYPDYNQSGYIYNEDRNRPELYFANFSKSDLLIFYDIEGNSIDTFFLKKMQTELNTISKAAIIHKSQYLGIAYDGNTIILDSLGDVVKQFNINDFFIDLTDSLNYEYIYATSSSARDSSIILVYPLWTSTKKIPYDSIVEIANTDYKRYLRLAQKYTKKTPLAFQLIIDETNTISSKTIFEDYNKRLVNDNEFLFGVFNPTLKYVDGKTMVVNRYHDSLWIVNEKDDVKSYHIPLQLSKNSDFLKYPTIINFDDTAIDYRLGAYLDTIENRMLKNAYFRHIHYNEKENEYLLLLREPLQPKNGDDLTLDFGFERKNIIKLDSGFKVVSETILEKGKYRPLSYLIKEGLLISTDNPNVKEYNPNVYTFDLFEVD